MASSTETTSRIMSIRTRKLIGAFALFALVIVWALLAMAIAQFPPIFSNPLDRRRSYYVVAGLGWVLPAHAADPSWMSERRERRNQVTLIRPAEAVPQRGGGARHQHLGVARPLELAVERNARQRGQVLGVLAGTARRAASSPRS